MRVSTQAKIAYELWSRGKSAGEVAQALGVSEERATQLYRRRLAFVRAGKTKRYWWDGLSPPCVRALFESDYTDVESLQVFADDDKLSFWRGQVKVPAFKEYWSSKWRLEHVNEVRAFIKAPPLIKPIKVVSQAELRRAAKLLRAHGYEVKEPT